MTDSRPLFLNGRDASAFLGFGRHKFRRLVQAGVIPSWTDPSTIDPATGEGTRHYSRLALEAWAARNGRDAA